MEATTTLVHVSMDPELHEAAEAAVQAGLPADLVERLRVTGVRSDRDPENRAEHNILAATMLWQREADVPLRFHKRQRVQIIFTDGAFVPARVQLCWFRGGTSQDTEHHRQYPICAAYEVTLIDELLAT